MTWKQTVEAGWVDILSPRPEEISRSAIAHELALVNRWTGDTALPWSVAAHSLLVAFLLGHDGASPRVQFYGLLHDAHEAITGDLTTPFQQAMEREVSGFRAGLKRVQGRLDEVIFPVFGLDPTPDEDERKQVKKYDLLALGVEAKFLLPGGPLPEFAEYLDEVAGDWREREWPQGLAGTLGISRGAIGSQRLDPAFVAGRWLRTTDRLVRHLSDDAEEQEA